MQNLLHVAQVYHALDYAESDVELLLLVEVALLAMNLVEKTTVLHVLSYKDVFFSGDAHAHIQDNVRVL